MQDNFNTEKEKAEALSAAIDDLNRGELPRGGQDDQVNELILTAKLVKSAVQPADAPPQAVLDNIMKQAIDTIAGEKRKKRQAWRFASLAGAVAAVLLAAFINIIPPVTQEPELAKMQQSVPAPASEAPQPPVIAKPPPNLTTPEIQAPASRPKPETAAPKAVRPQSEGTKPFSAEPQLPSVALIPPSSPVPADSDTMLALADRKADSVTIDAVSKIIRQVYRQGAPDEIIITQAPKRPSTLRVAPKPPQAQTKMAAPVPNESVDIKPPNRNKVTVTVENTEVTLEGTATEEELLTIAQKLTKVSVAK